MFHLTSILVKIRPTSHKILLSRRHVISFDLDLGLDLDLDLVLYDLELKYRGGGLLHPQHQQLPGEGRPAAAAGGGRGNALLSSASPRLGFDRF
jgi:hypothetical protein